MVTVIFNNELQKFTRSTSTITKPLSKSVLYLRCDYLYFKFLKLQRKKWDSVKSCTELINSPSWTPHEPCRPSRKYKSDNGSYICKINKEFRLIREKKKYNFWTREQSLLLDHPTMFPCGKAWRNGLRDFLISGPSFPLSLSLCIFIECFDWCISLRLSKRAILIGGDEQKPSLLSRVSGKQISKTNWTATENFYCSEGKCENSALDKAQFIRPTAVDISGWDVLGFSRIEVYWQS